MKIGFFGKAVLLAGILAVSSDTHSIRMTSGEAQAAYQASLTREYEIKRVIEQTKREEARENTFREALHADAHRTADRIARVHKLKELRGALLVEINSVSEEARNLGVCKINIFPGNGVIEEIDHCSAEERTQIEQKWALHAKLCAIFEAVNLEIKNSFKQAKLEGTREERVNQFEARLKELANKN
jgi:hypothetical protein